MIKHIFLAGVASLSIAAATTPVFAADAAAVTAASTGKPQLGAWGVDTAGMDRSVKPGDSFFDYVNGTWVKTTEIPADRSTWGGFAILRELSDTRTKAIIEDAAKSGGAPGSNAQKVGDFYASFMDEAKIEAAGAAPLKPYLAQIAAIKTTSDLAKAFGELGQAGVTAPIGAQVEQDLRDNTRYSAYIGQSGLGMPDRDYYLDDSNPKFVETRAKYKAHIATMLGLAGISDAAARAERIYDLEKKIATSHWTRAEQRQIEKLYNPMSRADLAKNMPGFDWTAYLDAGGSRQPADDRRRNAERDRRARPS